MSTDQSLARLRRFPTAVLCNAHAEVRALGASIRPAYEGARVFGPARTAAIEPGQNAAIHRAVSMAAPGDVVVVSAQGDLGHGPFGDLLAQACLHRRIAGLVIDGAIRDTAEVTELKFPVFCMGANPIGSEKADPGRIDVEIQCAGVRVRPGDLVSADDDGVVIVPRELVTELPGRAEAVEEREARIRARIAAGLTTCEIFGISLRPRSDASGRVNHE